MCVGKVARVLLLENRIECVITDVLRDSSEAGRDPRRCWVTPESWTGKQGACSICSLQANEAASPGAHCRTLPSSFYLSFTLPSCLSGPLSPCTLPPSPPHHPHDSSSPSLPPPLSLCVSLSVPHLLPTLPPSLCVLLYLMMPKVPVENRNQVVPDLRTDGFGQESDE